MTEIEKRILENQAAILQELDRKSSTPSLMFRTKLQEAIILTNDLLLKEKEVKEEGLRCSSCGKMFPIRELETVELRGLSTGPLCAKCCGHIRKKFVQEIMTIAKAQTTEKLDFSL